MSQLQNDPLLDHEYDGIREYDNPMPGWWKALFVISIVFAIGYAFWLHGGGGGKTVHQEFEEEVAAARELELKNAPPQLTEDELKAAIADPAVVDAGKVKFKEVCAVCHADNGEGKIGPNLTDKYWIHGKGAYTDIYQTIVKGVPEKGMPTWSKTLKAAELRALAAYVGSIRGTNVAGKEPQGEAVELGSAPAANPAVAAPAAATPAAAPAPAAVPAPAQAPAPAPAAPAAP